MRMIWLGMFTAAVVGVAAFLFLAVEWFSVGIFK
jgi:hypothetical protein